MSDAAYGPWIIWNGGECPVPGHEIVNIRASTGDEFTARARRLPWLARNADQTFKEPGLWTIKAYQRAASES